jgi:hypothetical protein
MPAVVAAAGELAGYEGNAIQMNEICTQIQYVPDNFGQL